MANYADAALAKAQAVIQSNFQAPEQRLKANGVFTPFARNTQFTVPNIADLRVSHQRPVDVNFFSRSKRTPTAVREARHVGNQGDSSAQTLTWIKKVDKASTSIKLAENTIWSDAQIIANEVDNMLKNIAEAMHVEAVAYLDTNKTGVNAATANGTFNGTNDVFEVLAADENFYFQYLKSMLEQNYYKGSADVIVDPRLYAKAMFQGSQGTGNATNFGYQFNDLLITQGIGLADADYANGIGFAIPEGTIGAVDWTPNKNRENFGDLDTYVGGFRTIQNPYLNGITCALSGYMDRADRSSVGGNEQDVVIQWEISSEIALVRAPLTTATETSIFATGQL